MIVLGLTGSIGMGKSTAADMLRQMKVPVHDADSCVHKLLEPSGTAYPAVAANFPMALARDGQIDRAKLGAMVFTDSAARAKLEAIVHPLVHESEDRFIQKARRAGKSLVVLDIPLLYETGAEKRVDAVIVVSAPAHIQRQRVLAREGMTLEKFKAILASQVPDAQKRKQADFVVTTGLGRAHTFRELKRIVQHYRIQHTEDPEMETEGVEGEHDSPSGCF